MLEFFKRMVGRVDADTYAKDSLEDARLRALEHAEAAAHHKALAQMYSERVNGYKSRMTTTEK